MPQDHKKLRPIRVVSGAAPVLTFYLATEDAVPNPITTENSFYIITEQTLLAATAGTFFDFANFKFF